MDKLPKDVVAEIAMELNNIDIIRLCKSNKKFNQNVCENESFWLNKILKEYPQVKNFKKIGNTYREIYQNLYLAEKKEIFIEINIESHLYEDEDEDDYEDEDEDSKINIGITIKYNRMTTIRELKRKIIDSITDFFEMANFSGRYSVWFDENEDAECSDFKHLDRCLESLNYDSSIIRITLDTRDSIDEDEKDYKRYLKESFDTYNVENY